MNENKMDVIYTIPVPWTYWIFSGIWLVFVIPAIAVFVLVVSIWALAKVSKVNKNNINKK